MTSVTWIRVTNFSRANATWERVTHDQTLHYQLFKCHMQVTHKFDRKKPPRGGFFVGWFPNQEPRGRAPPSKSNTQNRSWGFLSIKLSTRHLRMRVSSYGDEFVTMQIRRWWVRDYVNARHNLSEFTYYQLCTYAELIVGEFRVTHYSHELPHANASHELSRVTYYL